MHPQRVVLDLKAEKPVNAMRIVWANPYAKRYQVEYWAGTDGLDFDRGPKGDWKSFEFSAQTNGVGGTLS